MNRSQYLIKLRKTNAPEQPKKKWWKFTTGEKISMFAMTLSVFSIVFNVTQSKKTAQKNAQHDIAAVKPILYLNYESTDSSISVYVKNIGFGPARIISFWSNSDEDFFGDVDELDQHVDSVHLKRPGGVSEMSSTSLEVNKKTKEIKYTSTHIKVVNLKNAIIMPNNQALTYYGLHEKEFEVWNTKYKIKFVDIYNDTSEFTYPK